MKFQCKTYSIHLHDSTTVHLSLPRYIAKWPGCNDNVFQKVIMSDARAGGECLLFLLSQGFAICHSHCCNNPTMAWPRPVLEKVWEESNSQTYFADPSKSVFVFVFALSFERNPWRRPTLLIRQNHHLLIREASTNCSSALLQRKRWKKLRGTN